MIPTGILNPMAATVFILAERRVDGKRETYFAEAPVGCEIEDAVDMILEGDVDPVKAFMVTPETRNFYNVSLEVAYAVVSSARARGCTLTPDAFAFCETYGAVPPDACALVDGEFEFYTGED